MSHDQTHIDCCSHCVECFPPENRSEADLRRTFGAKPLFEMNEEAGA